MKRLFLPLVLSLATGACSTSDGAGGDGVGGGAADDAGVAGTGGEGTGAGGASGVGGMTIVSGSGGAIGAAGSSGTAGTRGGVGGATGTAGAGAAGGSPGMASCDAVPVTPNAIPQVRNVLCYLYSQYGNHILSGQEESGGEVEINYIFTNTGKYPAIRAFEANGDGAATRCLPYWNAGGLCMFGYHMGAPSTADGYTGSMTAVTGGIDSVLTPGSANNTVFNQRLDALARRLLLVQAGNGVVLFRPFHEAAGTWFWWSKEGGAQYARLWKYAFDRIVNTNGVRNAIWLLGYDGSPSAAFYPGKDFVDIGGADNYNATGNYTPMTSIFNAARTVFGTTMPIALHECGPVPDPDMLQATHTNWLFFNIWTQPYPQTFSTVAELQKVYTSSYVITRDEMPNLR
jgi:beta-mannanase